MERVNAAAQRCSPALHALRAGAAPFAPAVPLTLGAAPHAMTVVLRAGPMLSGTSSCQRWPFATLVSARLRTLE